MAPSTDYDAKSAEIKQYAIPRELSGTIGDCDRCARLALVPLQSCRVMGQLLGSGEGSRANLVAKL